MPKMATAWPAWEALLKCCARSYLERAESRLFPKMAKMPTLFPPVCAAKCEIKILQRSRAKSAKSPDEIVRGGGEESGRHLFSSDRNLLRLAPPAAHPLLTRMLSTPARP